MRIILSLSGLLFVTTSAALAGKNARGALVVHTEDAVAFTVSGDYCGTDYDAPGSCETAGTWTDKAEADPAVIWLLAAFHPDANPGVLVVEFGIDHNLPPGIGHFRAYGACGPDGTLEAPGAGWPEEPAAAGNAVTFGAPVAGEHLVPFYWFAATGFEGAYLGTSVHPTSGIAGFVGDEEPPGFDECVRFGQVRWYEDGSNDCPNAAPDYGACCFADGGCTLLNPAGCDAAGGTFQGLETVCDPNPCAQPGACCLPDGSCRFVLDEECAGHGGYYFLPLEPCEPNRCEPVPQGACCFTDGSCGLLTEEDCAIAGGDHWIGGGVCDPNPCAPLLGACCFADGSCSPTTATGCIGEGGVDWIEGGACDPAPCDPDPILGACCRGDETCAMTTEEGCYDVYAGYLWLSGAVCDPNPCPPIVRALSTWGSIKAYYR